MTNPLISAYQLPEKFQNGNSFFSGRSGSQELSNQDFMVKGHRKYPAQKPALPGTCLVSCFFVCLSCSAFRAHDGPRKNVLKSLSAIDLIS